MNDSDYSNITENTNGKLNDSNQENKFGHVKAKFQKTFLSKKNISKPTDKLKSKIETTEKEEREDNKSLYNS